jgi:hypothetical protein
MSEGSKGAGSPAFAVHAGRDAMPLKGAGEVVTGDPHLEPGDSTQGCPSAAGETLAALDPN